jgi:hypothetical protein
MRTGTDTLAVYTSTNIGAISVMKRFRAPSCWRKRLKQSTNDEEDEDTDPTEAPAKDTGTACSGVSVVVVRRGGTSSSLGVIIFSVSAREEDADCGSVEPERMFIAAARATDRSAFDFALTIRRKALSKYTLWSTTPSTQAEAVNIAMPKRNTRAYL